MGFFRQFDEFDPLTGAVPDHPFSHLPSIVSRARRLLKNRTRDEIVSAAHNADFFIEEYFSSEKADYIRRLLDRGGWELGYLPYEARNEAGVRELLDNWPSEADDPPPDIPTPENTSELDALKECIGHYVLDDDAEFSKGREFEYFAVLALWLVADALHWLNWTSDPKVLTKALQDTFAPMPPGEFPELTAGINEKLQESRDHVPELVESMQTAMKVGKAFGTTDTSISLSLAGSSALCAMDAVCYAEHLHDTKAQAEALFNLQLQIHQTAQKMDILAEEKAKQRVSLAASKAAIKRHAENRAMKEQVFEWCAAHLHEYPSMDAAAESIAGKVVPVTFRTARSWIGEYRKKGQSARKL
jgi:hypothetical protein